MFTSRQPLKILALSALAVGCAAPVGAVTREDDLTTWYLMGEKSGVIGGNTITTVTGIPDHSGAGVDAEVRGTPEVVDGNAFAPFPHGDSRSIATGGSDYLVAPDDSSFNFADEDFSYTFWLRSDGNGGTWKKLFQRNVAGAFVQAEAGSGGSVNFNIRMGGNSEILTDPFLGADADWHHLALIRNTGADKIQCYLDGVLHREDSTEPTVGSLAGSGVLTVGGGDNGGNNFEGEMDDFRIYDIALSADDVTAIYNAGAGDYSDPDAAVTQQNSIVGWYLMGENAITETVTTGEEVDGMLNEVAGAPDAANAGTPQTVPGVAFNPYFFPESKAIDTNGGNYFTAPDDPAYNFADEDFSFSLWCRSDGNGGQWKKLFQRNAGGGFYQVEAGDGGKINFNIRKGGNSEIMTDPFLAADSNWHHLVFIRNTGEGKIQCYLDGALHREDTNEPTVESLSGSGILSVGGGDGGNNVFEGNIDDFRVYRAALSAEDVLAIYNNGLGDFSPGGPSFQLEINHLPGTDEIEVKWPSQDGKLYNLRSTTDPASGAPIDWPIQAPFQDLAATAPENTITFARPNDLSLLVVEEFDAPPESIWSENFDAAAALPAGWTTGANTPPDSGSTVWEIGAPTSGPDAANSRDNCAGTNLASSYGLNTEIWLRSSPIDLTTAGGATLNYSRFVDIEESFDEGIVRVLDASDDSEIAVLQQGIDGQGAAWEQSSVSFPAAALGKSVKVEFFLDTDDFDDGAFDGFYVDDVNVTVP